MGEGGGGGGGGTGAGDGAEVLDELLLAHPDPRVLRASRSAVGREWADGTAGFR